jgi:hypothetical protein
MFPSGHGSRPGLGTFLGRSWPPGRIGPVTIEGGGLRGPRRVVMSTKVALVHGEDDHLYLEILDRGKVELTPIETKLEG